jgi:hypothetical protein
VTEASPTTIARWLAQDALKPWQHRSWIFPRDPDFLARAAPVLDLYAGRFEDRLLHPGDLVICADEKPSIQARARIHETVAPACSHGQLVEPTYERRGALTYLAAWDVRRGRETQQAFLEAHVEALEWFGGVFARVRYDNLASGGQAAAQGPAARGDRSLRRACLALHARLAVHPGGTPSLTVRAAHRDPSGWQPRPGRRP